MLGVDVNQDKTLGVPASRSTLAIRKRRNPATLPPDAEAAIVATLLPPLLRQERASHQSCFLPAFNFIPRDVRVIITHHTMTTSTINLLPRPPLRPSLQVLAVALAFLLSTGTQLFAEMRTFDFDSGPGLSFSTFNSGDLYALDLDGPDFRASKPADNGSFDPTASSQQASAPRFR